MLNINTWKMGLNGVIALSRGCFLFPSQLLVLRCFFAINACSHLMLPEIQVQVP